MGKAIYVWVVTDNRGAGGTPPIVAFTVKYELVGWLKRRLTTVQDERREIFARLTGDPLDPPLSWSTLNVWRMWTGPGRADPVDLGSPAVFLNREATAAARELDR